MRTGERREDEGDEEGVNPCDTGVNPVEEGNPMDTVGLVGVLPSLVGGERTKGDGVEEEEEKDDGDGVKPCDMGMIAGDDLVGVVFDAIEAAWEAREELYC